MPACKLFLSNLSLKTSGAALEEALTLAMEHKPLRVFVPNAANAKGPTNIAFATIEGELSDVLKKLDGLVGVGSAVEGA